MSAGSPFRGRGSARGSLSPSSLPSSPQAAASPSALARHARRFTPLTGVAPPTASSPNVISSTSGAGSSSVTSADVASRSPASPEGGMSSRAALSLLISPRTRSSAWLPTRLTSPYCVLSAAGLQEDFYTSCLSWGANLMALALQEDLVLFHPSHPRQASSTARISAAPSASSGTTTTTTSTTAGPRRATAVAMTRFHETACFLGTSSGAVELYEGRGDGTLQCTTAFAMPPPPTDYLTSLVLGGGDGSGPSSRAARALALLSSSVSSISCIGTCGRHPWLGAAATAARGLVTLDARQAAPALCFGRDADLTEEERGGLDAPSASASASTSASAPSGGQSKLQRASTFLRQHDRLCSVSWNATGSLVATGSGSGVVKVWSLSAPQRPLHVFLVDPDCSVKALCFHPSNSYTLLVGASAGAMGLRTYDLSGADPVLAFAGSTAAPVMQALYDPEGHYAVTGAGMPLSPDAAALPSPPSASHGELGHLGTGALSLHDHVGGGGGGGPGGWRHSSPARPSGTSSSSAVVAASSGATLLWDSWDGTDDVSGSPLSVTLDAAGVAMGSEGSSGGSGTAGHSAPPNALVVWRCGTRGRESYLREALLHHDRGGSEVPGAALAPAGAAGWESEYRHSDEDGEDAADEGDAERDRAEEDGDGGGDGSDGSEHGDDHRHRHHRSSWHGVAGRAGGRGGGNARCDVDANAHARREWMPMYALPGHRARPLLLCAPFAQSPFAGCCASIAGGDDGTIRFWRLFETASDATHWQHRRQAQQQAATTQRDMDLLATPVLR